MKASRIILVFGILLAAVAASLITGIDLNYFLIPVAVIYLILARRMGYSLRAVLNMMGTGIKESAMVIVIMTLVSAMTGIWRACGTIPYLVTAGLKWIQPSFFILFAYLLAAGTSYLTGTSVGTCGTIGVFMMTMCAIGGANPLLTAGAVLSGAFFGDRCSPASSCSNLVASLSKTDIYRNVRVMLKDVILPTALTLGIYAVLSFCFPLQSVPQGVDAEIRSQFRLSILLILPALLIFAAPLVKVPIRHAMTVSVLVSCILAVVYQGIPLKEIPGILFWGYRAEGAYREMLSGGGIITMVSSNISVLITAAFSGIFNGTNMLKPMEEMLEKLSEKIPLFALTWLCGTALVMISCSQTLALMMETPLMMPIYKRKGKSNEEFMLDLADSTVLSSAIVPWSRASMNPIKLMGTGAMTIPFAFFLFLVPLVRLWKTTRD